PAIRDAVSVALQEVAIKVAGVAAEGGIEIEEVLNQVTIGAVLENDGIEAVASEADQHEPVYRPAPAAGLDIDEHDHSATAPARALRRKWIAGSRWLGGPLVEASSQASSKLEDAFEEEAG